MDGSDVKFLSPGTPGDLRFEIAQGTVSMLGRTLEFRGLGGVRHLSLGPGWSFDLTRGVGGTEQLHLSGVSEDYRVTMEGDVLMLSQLAQRTLVKLQAGRGPYNIVFDDGFVRVGDLWRSVTQAAAISKLAGACGSTDSAKVASHVHPSRDAAFQLGAHVLPEGALLRASSLDRVETVYQPSGSSPIGLEGAFGDYRFTTRGPVVSLNRQRRGCFEGTYLTGASQVVFADGQVCADALFNALQPAPSESIVGASNNTGYERPMATSVALSIDPMTVSCSESWFVGLANGWLLSGLCVGQVFDAAVTFNEAVFVRGAPQVQLRIGGLRRLARYGGCSGGNTLRFLYVVTADDVLEGALGPDGGDVARVDRPRLDIEVGDLLLNGAEILPASRMVVGEWVVAAEHILSSKVEPLRDHHRVLQEHAGFRVRVDVDLDALEQADQLLCL